MQRKTYIIITVSLAVLFVWFQIIMLNLVWDRNWVTNAQAAESTTVSLGTSNLLQSAFVSQPPMDAETMQQNEDVPEQSAYLKYYIIAPEKSAIYDTVALTLKLLRMPFESFTTLDLLPETPPDSLTGVIICTGDTDSIGNVNKLFNYLALKKEALFAAKLDQNASNYYAFCEKLDIVESYGEVAQEGIDFLDDVLLSGLYLDAKVDTVVNDVRVGGRSRLYAVGHNDDVPTNERYPIIWRTLHEGGAVYVINSDMLENFAYMGVLTGVLGQNKEAFVYPIVNSSTFMINALPYYSTENSHNLLTAYSRDIIQLQRDVLWSDIISISKSMEIKYTFFPYTGEGQSDIEAALLEYYGKEISYNSAEIGAYKSDIFAKTFPNYRFATELFYHLPQSGARVIAENNVFGYLDDNTVILPATTQGIRLSQHDVFEAISLSSGLGYLSHLTDLMPIMEDTSGIDQWTQVKRSYGDGLYDLLIRTKHLKKDTAAEAAEKMRVYLQSRPEVDVLENEIIIKGQDIGETFFVFRSVRDITGYENCEMMPLRFKTYLVTVPQGKDAVIHTKEAI